MVVNFCFAPDIKKRLRVIVKRIKFNHIHLKKVVCFRSQGSKSNAYARIWAMPKIWQKALNIEPHYCIEILSEKFDKLSLENKTKVLIHEVLHIPKNFSGSLLSHKGRGRRIDQGIVNSLYQRYKNN